MRFFRAKQPIALPVHSDDEALLKDNKEFDPDLATNDPQQHECAKRCCLKKKCRGRKVVRRIGHFLILGAFLYWLWRPAAMFYHGGPKLQDIEFSDFTDLGSVFPSTVGKDFVLPIFDSDEELKCDEYADWSEPKEIGPPCHRHHRHRHPKSRHPDEPEPSYQPDRPDHPHEPGHPHNPDHPHDPHRPHKPHHPHRPGHPHRPHHPHRPGRRPHGPKYTSDATFKLPLSDSSLLFYSHGPFAYGGIKFSQDDSDSLKSDEVEVTVNAKIWNKDALELAKVCTLKREHGAGLGIWTEPVDHENPEERKKREMALRISVKFPKHPDASEIEKLKTHMPLFAHFFETDLRVKDLEATTWFLPIKAKALSVERGKLRTEHNTIIGNFTATELLVLETANSPIAANVTLANDPGKDDSGDDGDELAGFSKLFIKTSNSPVYGNVSLLATTKHQTGGKFLVDALTSNSPLHIHFADAPVDSILRFFGLTSNSPAMAVMHPTFQGDFLVKSTLFGPKVDITQDVKDPKGEGRTRTVEASKVGKQILGKVFWGSEEESKDAFGHVELGSTLLRALLKL